MLESTRPISVFIAYSHKDEAHKDVLLSHLSALRRLNKAHTWHDRKIEPGQPWQEEIDKHLNDAKIILLLISADFIASDYCYTVETSRAIERHNAGEACVIPVILRPCEWTLLSFGMLQAVPKDGKPVSKWEDIDEAFTDIASGVRLKVESFCVAQRSEKSKASNDAGLQSADESSAKVKSWSDQQCQDCRQFRPDRCAGCYKCFNCLGQKKSWWRSKLGGQYYCDTCWDDWKDDGSGIACS
jgi:hypothetical protein